jgi:magnesium-transporting ATPase (P-type)
MALTGRSVHRCRYIQLKNIQSSSAVIGLTSFASWLILLNVIIPISLYVYIELVKLVMVSPYLSIKCSCKALCVVLKACSSLPGVLDQHGH